jgi:hypothetical protein
MAAAGIAIKPTLNSGGPMRKPTFAGTIRIALWGLLALSVGASIYLVVCTFEVRQTLREVNRILDSATDPKL